jgi:GT2 family glycosyltransferase
VEETLNAMLDDEAVVHCGACAMNVARTELVPELAAMSASFTPSFSLETGCLSDMNHSFKKLVINPHPTIGIPHHSGLNLKVHSAAIVVNWNSWKDLDRCLEALARKSLPFHRIVVIDNNSSKPIPDSINRWLALDKVEFLNLPANVGFAKANNVGIEKANDCEWVALVNPDAFLDRLWHEQMLKSTDQYPTAASFSSTLVMANEQTRWDGLGDAYHMSGLVWRIGHGSQVDYERLSEEQVFSPCAAAALYRCQALLEVGGFDEDYFCYLEDVDLGFRLRLLGYSSVLIPQAIAYHVGSASTGGQDSDFSVYHGHRNLVWTYIKNMPGALFWFLLPIHLAMNIATVIWFALNGRGAIILRAKRDALMRLPLIWLKRKAVQRSRQCFIGEIWRILDKQLFSRR